MSVIALLPDQLNLAMQKWASNLMVPRAPCGVNPALQSCPYVDDFLVTPMAL